ncbi:MAG: class I SAM-dependent methyltransferase [Cyclobacteriaceae bacterium]|nr:class I SAM-dependent methyltransferase [Cyclobacteriaceae bacterium]
MELYKDKNISYFSNVREDLINLIPKDSMSILEIGAGGGDTLLEIKRRDPRRIVYGLELNNIEGSNQANSLIDKFIFGNIENDDVDISKFQFDVILIGDVLEHLIDPWKVLNKIKSSLNPKGLFIVSIPNARHYRLISSLLFGGTFNYQEQGVLDKTHLRFFCKKDSIDLFESAKLKVESIDPIFKYYPESNKIKWFNRLTLGLFEEFISLQYVVIARYGG